MAILDQERRSHVQFILKRVILTLQKGDTVLKLADLLFLPFAIVLGHLTIPFPLNSNKTQQDKMNNNRAAGIR
jgi:hypothetical protein